jgi:hypothetical protein
VLRRLLYWLGVVFGVAALAAGVVVTALGIAATPGPGAVVRAYYDALAHGDAPTALAYGTVPRGPRLLLTSAVLAEQQDVAPIRDISITSAVVHGTRATVEVRYVLGFPSVNAPVTDRLGLHKDSGDWRLDRVAVATAMRLDGARARLSALGAQVPTGRMLLFPGALPLRLDTPYLQLDAFHDTVTFDALSNTDVAVEVSKAGRDAMLGAVRDSLRSCLEARAAPTCPLPNERFVPGSIRGTIRGDLRATNVYVLGDRFGTLRFAGSAAIHGTWTRLNFHNQRVTGHGTVLLHLQAVAYATAPIRLHWVAS